MAILDNIQVSIEDASPVQALHEYEDPDATPLNATNTRGVKKYIEARDHQTFSIAIILLENFNWSSANCLAINLKCDDGAVVNERYIFPKSRFISEPDGIHSLRLVESLMKHIDGRKKCVNFAFTPFPLDDELLLDRERLDKLGSEQGRLELTISRVKAKGDRVVGIPERLVAKQQGEEHMKLLTHKKISHTTTWTRETQASDVQFVQPNERLRGSSGKPLSFVFRYCSRTALELLGCVNGVSRAEVEVGEALSDGEWHQREIRRLEVENEGIRAKIGQEQRLRQLRAENAALRSQEEQVKREPSTTDRVEVAVEEVRPCEGPSAKRRKLSGRPGGEIQIFDLTEST